MEDLEDLHSVLEVNKSAGAELCVGAARSGFLGVLFGAQLA